jgi:membrane-associated phospholipid phosphatase
MAISYKEVIKKGVVSFCCCVLISLTICAQNWDIDLLKDINPRYPTSWYWRTTSNSAYYLGVGIPIGLLLTGVVRHDTLLIQKSGEVVGSVLIELVISEGLKYAVNRERPGDRYPRIIFPYSGTHGYSFPSGHSSLAFSLAAGLSVAYGKWYVSVPAYIWASTVGYSRMYLGVHYPSDVLAGAAIGVGSAYLSAWLNRRFFGVNRRHG